MAAWQAQHTYRPDRGPLAAWLSGITKHRTNDAISARTRQRERHDRYAQRHGPDEAHDTLTDQLPGHLDSSGCSSSSPAPNSRSFTSPTGTTSPSPRSRPVSACP
ncbi:hypothetical protein ACWEDZ_12075 [Streptomyces sp. NPDC005047]